VIIVIVCIIVGAGAALGALAATFGPRLIDRLTRRDPDGIVTADEMRRAAKRIDWNTQEIRAQPEPETHPEPEPEPVVEPEPVPVAWYDLPPSPDEATPHLPGVPPVLEIDLGFTRCWNRADSAELNERIRAAEERAEQAGLVTR
jgi:hypothetical protein